MGKERMVLPDKRKLRNLKQYASLSDEEFDEIWEQKLEAIEVTPEMLEKRIKERLDELAEDYDMESDDVGLIDVRTGQMLSYPYTSLRLHLHTARRISRMR